MKDIEILVDSLNKLDNFQNNGANLRLQIDNLKCGLVELIQLTINEKIKNLEENNEK